MKKIRITRALAIVLTVAMMICALAGCGGKKKSDAELIVGKWSTTIDFEKVLQETLASDDSEEAEIFKGLDFSGIKMDMTFNFGEDGAYTTEVDKESGEAAVKKVMSQLAPAMKEILRKTLSESYGVSADEITDDMLDGMLALLGADSWEDLGELLMEGMTAEEIFQDANLKGRYLVKDGKLYLSDGDKDPALEEGQRFEVNDKTLKLTLSGSDVPEFMKELILKRVG